MWYYPSRMCTASIKPPLFRCLLLVGLCVCGSLGARDRQIESRICDSVVLVGPERIRLSSSEVRLVCGDTQVQDWKSIPRTQAFFHLGTFLQSRGFYAPVADRSPGKVFRISIGTPTEITAIRLLKMPEGLRAWSEDAFQGERLTPETLDRIELRVRERLGRIGFACLELETQANAQTGLVTIRLGSGKPQILLSVKEQSIPELQPETLRRFDAFVIGSRYNRDSMQLTSNRIIADGIVRNTFFDASCADEGVTAHQNVIGGHPREISLGFGLNTDRGLYARAGWRQTRLDSRGSSLVAEIAASIKGGYFHSERLSLESKWFFLTPPSRFYLWPHLSVERRSDNRLDLWGAEVGLSPATSWDTENGGGVVSLGPQFKWEQKVRGEGRDEAYYLSLLGEFQMRSHDFELRRSDPRSGFEWINQVILSRKGLLADYSANTLRSRFTYLHGFGGTRRSEIILGFRTELDSTFLAAGEGGFSSLPPGLRHYLGGSANLRGFSFQELPGSAGALTTYFLGAEARAIGWLPFDLELLAFADIGTASTQAFDFSSTWFASPGAGLRWLSPIGSLRLSLAHGLVLGAGGAKDPRAHWQFHLTLGEEF